MTDGPALSFGAARADAARIAGYLNALGVAPGDAVILMLPSGLDFVRAWLGIGRLGATAVLLNPELRGSFLEHQVRNCGAALAIVDATLLDVFREATRAIPTLRRICVAGGTADPAELADFAQWVDATPWTGARPRYLDTFCIMYTSGTSGPAKGVVMPHAHCTLYGIGTIRCFQLGPFDRYYIVLPLFHVNGLLMQLGATLLAGITAVVRPRFSASGWLADVREHRATVTNTLGTLAAFIIAQPPSRADRDHGLRALLNAPNPPPHEAAFRARFGVRDVLSGFGMTECNIPVWGRLGESRPGAAGWTHTEHFDLIVADPDTDAPCAPGEVGEILVRPKVAFGFMREYLGLPDKTVEAWRNLWFHTGDAATLGADGLVTFVDRIKDRIRRRGENISANEIEAALATLAGIAEVCACAVPSGRVGDDDEILLAIVVAADAGLSRESIAAHADQVLPRFARPRFIRILSELPKTSTGKVQRAALRAQGADGAWDRGQ
jgi:crotonobetaine/carnitine-CoA ligase